MGTIQRLAFIATTVAASLLMACGTSSDGAPHHQAAVIEEEPVMQTGMTVYKGPQTTGPVVLLTDVAVDEEFIERVGEDWEREITRILVHANETLGQIGLRLQLSTINRWESDDEEVSLSRLLDSVDSRDPGLGRLLLAITCQDTVVFDGWADPSSRRAIVQYYHDVPSRTAALISHELGHLLGAKHHDDEDECDLDGCIMDQKGYVHADTWCDHHKEQIRSFLNEVAM